ncbi:hypothetical protein NMY22_g14445 [Coprinellus aureogranulatus]|nr:hypothetical protein NMY22_g14445 [Coprinellus aureogranulatus]
MPPKTKILSRALLSQPGAEFSGAKRCYPCAALKIWKWYSARDQMGFPVRSYKRGMLIVARGLIPDDGQDQGRDCQRINGFHQECRPRRSTSRSSRYTSSASPRLKREEKTPALTPKPRQRKRKRSELREERSRNTTISESRWPSSQSLCRILYRLLRHLETEIRRPRAQGVLRIEVRERANPSGETWGDFLGIVFVTRGVENRSRRQVEDSEGRPDAPRIKTPREHDIAKLAVFKEFIEGHAGALPCSLHYSLSPTPPSPQPVGYASSAVPCIRDHILRTFPYAQCNPVPPSVTLSFSLANRSQER